VTRAAGKEARGDTPAGRGSADADVSSRLAEFERTRDLDALWPDLTRADRRAATSRIREVVEGVLTASSRVPALDAAAERDVRALGVAAFTAGLGPLLGWWIGEGRVRATSPVRDLFIEHLEHGRRRSAMLRNRAATIARSMHAEGIRPILLKGLHTGGEFFPHPSTRPAADIDLLVATAEETGARVVLGRLGFTETRKTAFADRSEWSPPGGTGAVRSIELDHVDNPWNVDLHRTLERWYFRGTRRDLGPQALRSTRTTTVEGEPVHVLEQPYLTAFLALHAGSDLSRVQLVRLIELVWVVRADRESGRLDWQQLGALFERTDTGRFAYPALALAEELVPGTVEPSILDTLSRRASSRMHRVLAAIRREDFGLLPERTLDEKLAWASGSRELVMSWAEILAPSDDGSSFVERYRRRGAMLRRWIRRPLGGSRGSRGNP
jgi:hypothetical protein